MLFRPQWFNWQLAKRCIQRANIQHSFEDAELKVGFEQNQHKAVLQCKHRGQGTGVFARISAHVHSWDGSALACMPQRCSKISWSREQSAMVHNRNHMKDATKQSNFREKDRVEKLSI